MTLHLILKAKWFNAIKDGGKREEYREKTPYWEKRLMKTHGLYKSVKIFDAICFHKGYTKTCITFKWQYLGIGRGKPEWGAPIDRNVFIIHFSNRLN